MYPSTVPLRVDRQTPERPNDEVVDQGIDVSARLVWTSAIGSRIFAPARSGLQGVSADMEWPQNLHYRQMRT